VAGEDLLAAILARKRREVVRRRAHQDLFNLSEVPLPAPSALTPAEGAYRALSRANGALKIIAEIKFASPSAGLIRVRSPGMVGEIANAFARAGASAISVLCDRPGFSGTVLDLRRAARAVTVPLLFKEFVIDPIQIRLARRLGAHMVLLIVRALSPSDLRQLVGEVLAQGLAPLVEAADEREIRVALETGTRIVGVNARDLRSFRVDREAAARLIDQIPSERIAVYMSGISSRDQLAHVAATRADAALIGEALMRAPQPGERLRELIGS
jgi:indole-3-glycerol phosphate synthase